MAATEPVEEFTETTMEMIRERLNEIQADTAGQPDYDPEIEDIAVQIIDALDAAVANVMRGVWNLEEFFHHVGAFVASLKKDEG